MIRRRKVPIQTKLHPQLKPRPNIRLKVSPNPLDATLAETSAVSDNALEKVQKEMSSMQQRLLDAQQQLNNIWSDVEILFKMTNASQADPGTAHDTVQPSTPCSDETDNELHSVATTIEQMAEQEKIISQHMIEDVAARANAIHAGLVNAQNRFNNVVTKTEQGSSKIEAAGVTAVESQLASTTDADQPTADESHAPPAAKKKNTTKTTRRSGAKIKAKSKKKKTPSPQDSPT